MIPYAKPTITKEDQKAILKLLKTPNIAQGDNLKKFENAINVITGSQYCIAVNSATSALHLACLALNLKKNDNLWTTSNTFVASANCALLCGANVDFVDIDLNTFNLSPHILEKKLKNTSKKLHPKILVNVHLGGYPSYQKQIYNLSKKYNFKIIEDASHSLGAKTNDNLIGSCKWSHLTVFSFHAVKIITTAEGGAITTNDERLSNKIQLLRSHGITKQKEDFIYQSNYDYYYEQQILGYNNRLNELQATLGLSQLKKLDIFIKKRNNIAERYKKKLKDLPIFFQEIDKNTISSFHLFIILIDIEKVRFDNVFLAKELKKNKIFACLHYMPVHLQPFYKKLGFKKNYLENTEHYAKYALSLPIYPELKNSEQDYIINTIIKIFTKNA
tara:strand:+ start:1250 stop:2413 length:1164 start_codon:yes stop_codon:yes gene_type:complete